MATQDEFNEAFVKTMEGFANELDEHVAFINKLAERVDILLDCVSLLENRIRTLENPDAKPPAKQVLQ